MMINYRKFSRRQCILFALLTTLITSTWAQTLTIARLNTESFYQAISEAVLREAYAQAGLELKIVPYPCPSGTIA